MDKEEFLRGQSHKQWGLLDKRIPSRNQNQSLTRKFKLLPRERFSTIPSQQWFFVAIDLGLLCASGPCLHLIWDFNATILLCGELGRIDFLFRGASDVKAHILTIWKGLYLVYRDTRFRVVHYSRMRFGVVSLGK